MLQVCLESTSGPKYLSFPVSGLLQHPEFSSVNVASSLPRAQSDADSFDKDNKDQEEEFVCYICNKYRTSRRQNLDRHQQNRHGTRKSCRPAIERKRGPAKRLNLVPGTVYRCDQCTDYVTTNEKYLYYHKRNCHQPARYSCDQCGYATRLLSSLKRHLAALHEQVRHPCHLCDYSATNKHLLKVSVAKGPKFRPQSTKRAETKLAGPGKSGAKFLPDLSKKGRKGAELFSSLVFHKILYIFCSKEYTYKLVYLSFLTTLDLEQLKKLPN
jgi:predicted nucleic acid-binding Zn ribbon protein